jgi:hypothetical protein
MVEMHEPVPWVNKLLFPPDVTDKRNEPRMLARLSDLIKWVAELQKAGLKACHCTEEFYLQRIHPLGRRERLAYDCPSLADPVTNLLMVRSLTSLFNTFDIVILT